MMNTQPSTKVIEDLRRLVARGWTISRAAKALGMSKHTAGSVLNGRRWSHLGVKAPPTRGDRMLRLLSPSNEEWISLALEAVCKIAERMPFFTMDDVREIIPDPPLPVLLGSVMRLARADGICSPSGRYMTSTRPEAQRRKIQVWQSEI